MGIIHYYGKAGSEAKIGQLVDRLARKEADLNLVDFPFDIRWARLGHLFAPDYEENWAKYGLCSFAYAIAEDYNWDLPRHFKGAVIDLDEGCDPLWLAFGRYSGDRWVCHNSTITQYARSGFSAHIRAVKLLQIAKPIMDDLVVLDEAGLWETDDLEASYQSFRASERRLKNLSLVLRKAYMECGSPGAIEALRSPRSLKQGAVG